MTKSNEAKQLQELEKARNQLAEQIERSQKALLELDEKIAELKGDLEMESEEFL